MTYAVAKLRSAINREGRTRGKSRSTLLIRTALFGALIFATFGFRAQGQTAVRVGAYENQPKIFSTQEGEYVGIFPDILKHIATAERWEITYVPGTWDENLHRLEAGKIDIMVDVARSKEREKRMRFGAESVFVNWGTVFARSGLRVDSVLDLRDKTVAVMRGSIHTDGEHGIKRLLSRFETPCRFVDADDYAGVFALVDAGAADAGVVNRLFGTMAAHDFMVVPTPITFNPQTLMFAAPRNSEKGEQLLATLDRHLHRMKRDPDSVYHQILTYYLAGGRFAWAPGILANGYVNLELTDEERRWIAAHPVIRVGVDPGFAPFEFVSEHGEVKGLAADYTRLLSERIGIVFDVVPDLTWPEAVEGVRRREIDVLTCVGITEARKDFVSFTEPYARFSRVIIAPLDSDIQSIDDLAGKRAGVQRSSSHHGFITEDTSIRPILFDTFEDAMLAVSRGQIDAVIGNLAVATHVMHELSLTNVKLAAYAGTEPQELCMAVRNDWPQLTVILNKALNAVTPRERRAILGQWLPLPAAASADLDLSREEREWLLMHPVVRYAFDANAAPVEFADTRGHAQGISPDYLREIGAMLGIRFEAVAWSGWGDMQERAEREGIDVLSSLVPTPNRVRHFDFTLPYLSVPVVVYARQNTPYVGELDELNGRKVSMVEGRAAGQWVQRDHAGIIPVECKTVESALRKLSKGETSAFVGEILPGTYYLEKLRQPHIKIAGDTHYVCRHCMAVRADRAPLGSALQKALYALPAEKKNAIYNKWVSVHYEHGFNYSLFWKLLLPAVALLLVFAFWNRRLSQEIHKRMEAQRELQTAYEELRRAEELRDNLTNMVVHDMRSLLTVILGGIYLIMRDDSAAGLSDEVRECLEPACDAAEALVDMATSLLDVSRLEAGEMPLHKQTCDIRQLAATVVSRSKPQAELRNVELSVSGPSALATADPDLIQRTMMNLITNALRFTPARGSIHVNVSSTKEDVRVEVTDTGPGIPPADQARIFDKFTQIRAGTEGRKASSGLGLAYCRLTIEAHGGTIGLISDPGHGSTFWFSLPQYP